MLQCFSPELEPLTVMEGFWVKGYVGMTEEQRRLMTHCNLLVWYRNNDFSSLHTPMDKSPDKCNRRARFLERNLQPDGDFGRYQLH